MVGLRQSTVKCPSYRQIKQKGGLVHLDWKWPGRWHANRVREGEGLRAVVCWRGRGGGGGGRRPSPMLADEEPRPEGGPRRSRPCTEEGPDPKQEGGRDPAPAAKARGGCRGGATGPRTGAERGTDEDEPPPLEAAAASHGSGATADPPPDLGKAASDLAAYGTRSTPAHASQSRTTSREMRPASNLDRSSAS